MAEEPNALSLSGVLKEIVDQDLAAAPQWDVFTAASLGHTAALQAILDADASAANRRNHAGWTPFIYAARYERRDSTCQGLPLIGTLCLTRVSMCSVGHINAIRVLLGLRLRSLSLSLSVLSRC